MFSLKRKPRFSTLHRLGLVLASLLLGVVVFNTSANYYTLQHTLKNYANQNYKLKMIIYRFQQEGARGCDEFDSGTWDGQSAYSPSDMQRDPRYWSRNFDYFTGWHDTYKM